MKLCCNCCDGAFDSLDVRFTKACDNNCSFCIEKEGIPALPMAEVDNLITNTLKTKISSVLILGGEPFLYPERLLEYVKGIRPFVRTIYITTSLPKTMMNHGKEVFEIMKLINGLNVSIQSIFWKENNEILKASSQHNRLNILRALNDIWADKIRTSVNLVKGGLDTKEKLILTLRSLSDSFGCKFVKINELQHEKDLYISYEDIMGIKLPSPYSHGCSTMIDHFKEYGMKILLKRSCFLVEESRQATFTDLVKVIAKRHIKPQNKFAVMYEDGSVKGGWISGKKKNCDD